MHDDADIEPHEIGQVTDWFLKHGINLLYYTDTVPPFYIYGSEQETMDIPQGIVSIDRGGLSGAFKLRDITLPDVLCTFIEMLLTDVTPLRKLKYLIVLFQ